MCVNIFHKITKVLQVECNIQDKEKWRGHIQTIDDWLKHHCSTQTVHTKFFLNHFHWLLFVYFFVVGFGRKLFFCYEWSETQTSKSEDGSPKLFFKLFVCLDHKFSAQILESSARDVGMFCIQMTDMGYLYLYLYLWLSKYLVPCLTNVTTMLSEQSKRNEN